MKSVFSLVCILSFSILPSFSITAAPVGASPSPGSVCPVSVDNEKQSAVALTRTMGKALAAIAEITQLPENQQEPSWHTKKIEVFMKALSKAVDQVGVLQKDLENSQGIANAFHKNPSSNLFVTMTETGTAFATLQVAYRYSGLVDDDIDNHFRKLVAAYQIFRRNYGIRLPAAHSEAESILTEDQKNALFNLKGDKDQIEKQWAKAPAAIKENPAVSFEFQMILKALNRASETVKDRAGLLKSLINAEIVVGRWLGLKGYIESVYPNDAAKLNSTMDKVMTAYQRDFLNAVKVTFAKNSGSTFAQPVSFPQDIAVADVSDKESEQVLRKAQKPVNLPAASPVQKETEENNRLLDQQINKDDPDDDTGLELEDSEGA